MAKAGKEDQGAQIGVRLPQDMLERIDQLIPYLAGLPNFSALGRQITRSLVVRYALNFGLEVLEREAEASGKGPKGR
jgi:Arc/MetJ-type ribon-helix-helix transcriptional regulator